MKMYLRLDDACEKRNLPLWNRMEEILDKYSIKPLFGIIPHCEDSMMEQYDIDEKFWDRVNSWIYKGWVPALHGYNHVCTSDEGGINPINKRSEFAGIPLDVQFEKIKKGVEILRSHSIEPKVFFAPSHTFDENTILALKECSSIYVISDTIANKPYSKNGITFVPQQSGHVRKLPFNTITFCYHPNTMKDIDFIKLEEFLLRNKKHFRPFPVETTNRRFSLIDMIIKKLYFSRRK